MRLFRIKKHKIFKDLTWTFLSQAMANLLRFLLIFVVIRCYTKEEFGLWASITSLAAVIVTGDFGLTNVLRNIASEGLSKGKEGEENTKNAWITSVLFLTFFSVLGISLLFLYSEFSIFENLFMTDNSQMKRLGNGLVFIVIGLFFINLPFSLTSGLFLSYGKVKEISLFNILSSILTFIIVCLLSFLHIRIDIVSIAFFSCPLVVSILSTLFFLKELKWKQFKLTPKRFWSNLSIMLPAGMKFVGIGFTSHFIPNTLTIYSGAMLGLSFAANINVAIKIYSFFVNILVGLLNPIWARLSQMFYNREYSNCVQMMKRNILGLFFASVFVVLITVMFRKHLIFFIAGSEYEANLAVFVLVGGCLFGKAIADSASLLLFATNHLNLIMIEYTIFSLIAFFVFPYIINTNGFNWMMFVMIICWMFVVVISLKHTKSILQSAIKTPIDTNK